MTAKEYYDRIKGELDQLVTLEQDLAFTKKVYIDFAMEVRPLYEIRKAKSSQAFWVIIKEQNQKWNALAHIIKKQVRPILKHDGFQEMIVSMMEVEV